MEGRGRKEGGRGNKERREGRGRRRGGGGGGRKWEGGEKMKEYPHHSKYHCLLTQHKIFTQVL